MDISNVRFLDREDTMDDYLKCLYDHVMDGLLPGAGRDRAEHDRRSREQERAWDALWASLSPEQIGLVEDYQAAQAETCALEDEWLFQEGVALGKWLARP